MNDVSALSKSSKILKKVNNKWHKQYLFTYGSAVAFAKSRGGHFQQNSMIVVPISEIFGVYLSEDSKKVFCIRTEREVYQFKAKSLDKAKIWVQNICGFIQDITMQKLMSCSDSLEDFGDNSVRMIINETGKETEDGQLLVIRRPSIQLKSCERERDLLSSVTELLMVYGPLEHSFSSNEDASEVD